MRATKSHSSRPWWRRGLCFLLFALVVVVTLLVLAGSVISYQGRREWDATKRELLANGEKLSLAEQLPPVIPDEMNFFADPIWEEILPRKGAEPRKMGFLSEPPLVPVEKQQLGAFSRPLPKEEIESLKKSYPQFASLEGANTSRIGVTGPAWVKAKEHDAAWRKNLAVLTLATLKPLDPLLDRMLELLQRPAGSFPTNYEAGYFAGMPHVSILISLGQTFSRRAMAELELGQGALALRDALAVFKLSRTVQAEPFLISYLVRGSLLSIGTNLVARGIELHAWSDGDLVALEQALRGEDLRPGLRQALRGERGSFNMMLETLRGGSFAPLQAFSGKEGNTLFRDGRLANIPAWAYLTVFGPGDQAYENRYLQKRIDNLATRGGSMAGEHEFDEQLTSNTFRFTHIFSTLTLPGLFSSFQRGALLQTHVNQARIACALERYYLAHLEYPKTLEELVPEYLSAVLVDIMDGQPMHYERAAAGEFKLWSVGGDGQDDGGMPAERNKLWKGDWVWGKGP